MDKFQKYGGFGLGIVGAGIGLAAGITDRSDQNDASDLVNAAVGGAVGFAIPSIIKGVGSVALGAIDYAARRPEGAKKLGKTVLGTAGDFTIEATKLGVDTAEAIGKTTANVFAGATKAFADNFLDYNPEKYKNFTHTGLSRKGKLAAALLVGGYSLLRANEAYSNSRMGTPTGVVNSTPVIESNSNGRLGQPAEAYGAGGDLVFALNRNRRG